MRKSSVCLAALSAAFAVGLTSAAQADGLAFDQNLAPPGVYYGTGNSNGHFTVDTEAGVEVALRAHVRFQDATAPTGDLYTFGLGDSLSFDWSINPDVGGPQVTGYSAVITVHDFANNNTVSGGAIFPDTNLHLFPNGGPVGGYQNSLPLSFVDAPLYDATQNNTFSVNLTLTNVSGAPNRTISVTELIQQGSGFAVPEPATWAMMLLGFGGIGATLRRARRTSAAATA